MSRLAWSKATMLLLVLYTGALLYGTLMPFQFTGHPERDQKSSRRQIEWVPFTRTYRMYGIFWSRDTVLNLVMFIPFGALATLVAGGRINVARSTARAGVLGFSLSLMIETTQYFIPTRFPSSTDLILNSVGAGLGGLMIASLLKWNSFDQGRPG